MKKLFKIILGATVGSTLLLSSCNFLDVDPYFEATFKEDSIFHSKKNAEGYLWNTPKGFPDAGAIWGNSWNPGESASDEITLKYQTNEFWGLQFSLIIFCLQHSNHRLDLRLDLCVVTGIHRTFIFRQRHIGRIPDTENGSCPKQQGCQ